MSVDFQQIHLAFSSWYSLLFLFLCFLGMLGWLTYIALTQRKLLKNVVMRDELPEIFRKFKEDLANGK